MRMRHVEIKKAKIEIDRKVLADMAVQLEVLTAAERPSPALMRLLPALLALALSACAVGPDYKAPESEPARLASARRSGWQSTGTRWPPSAIS